MTIPTTMSGKTTQQIINAITSMMNTIPNATESGRAFGKTATAFRAATGQRLRMGKAPKTYTIHRGTVRSAFALYHYVMPIYARQARARAALESGEAVGVVIRGERAELHAATARAEEASKMHLVPFVPPYVPAKASRAFPGLKSCTSPRRAAIARQRALFSAAVGTSEQARASGYDWYENTMGRSLETLHGLRR